MNPLMLGIKAVLILGILGLGYLLFVEIKEPIDYESARNERFDATVEKMETIKAAQTAFEEAIGKFAKDFDTLQHVLLKDSIIDLKIYAYHKRKDASEIAALGTRAEQLEPDPNDTAILQLKEYIPRQIMEARFPDGLDLENLRFIPFTDNKKEFIMNSDVIDVQNGLFQVPVFELKAPKQDWLTGLNKKYVANEMDLVLGSMNERKLSGNWK